MSQKYNNLGIDKEVLNAASGFTSSTKRALAMLPPEVSNKLQSNSNAWYTASPEEQTRLNQENKNIWRQNGYITDSSGNVIGATNGYMEGSHKDLVPNTGYNGNVQYNNMYAPVVNQAQLTNDQQVAQRWGFRIPTEEQYLQNLNTATKEKYSLANQGITSAMYDYNKNVVDSTQALRKALMDTTSTHVQSNGSSGTLAATLGQLTQGVQNDLTENAKDLEQQRIELEAAKAAELASNPVTAFKAIQSMRETLANLGLTQFANDVQQQGVNAGYAGQIFEGQSNVKGNEVYGSKSAEITSDSNERINDKNIANAPTYNGNGTYNGSSTGNGNASGDGTVSNVDVNMANLKDAQSYKDQAYAAGDWEQYVTARINYEQLMNGGSTPVTKNDVKRWCETDPTFAANIRKTTGTKLTKLEEAVIKNGKTEKDVVMLDVGVPRITYNWDGTFDLKTGKPKYTVKK